jgi:lysylphosphatidylglycerol synthetase-like protein (DUF2156 family)
MLVDDRQRRGNHQVNTPSRHDERVLLARLWSVSFTLVVLFALAGLCSMLFFFHAVAHGADSLLSAATDDPTVRPPDQSTYEAALVVSVLVAVALCLFLVGIARRTPVAAWPAALQGLIAAAVAGVPAYLSMTLMLHIDPITPLNMLLG